MDTGNPTPATKHETNPQPENKKLFYIVLGLVGLTLVAVIILLLILLMKKNAAPTTNNTESSAKQTTADKKASAKVVKTISLKDPNLEMLIYQPKINGANLTVNYSIRNICKGCENPTYASNFGANVDPRRAYLLDNENGRKYNVIIDADKNPLASESCSGQLRSGEKIDCFIAFTKPDPGISYAINFGSSGTPVEGLSVPR